MEVRNGGREGRHAGWNVEKRHTSGVVKKVRKIMYGGVAYEHPMELKKRLDLSGQVG